MAQTKPPYRAEHVGSLPRPERLMAVREGYTDSALYPTIGHIERAASFARDDQGKPQQARELLGPVYAGSPKDLIRSI